MLDCRLGRRINLAFARFHSKPAKLLHVVGLAARSIVREKRVSNSESAQALQKRNCLLEEACPAVKRAIHVENHMAYPPEVDHGNSSPSIGQGPCGPNRLSSAESNRPSRCITSSTVYRLRIKQHCLKLKRRRA